MCDEAARARRDARHVRAVIGRGGIERRARSRARTGRRKRTGDDHLAVRGPGDALREAGRIGVPGTRERGARDVDSVVDDADAHAIAERGSRPEQAAPQLRRADRRRHAVGLRAVARAEPHALDTGKSRQAIELTGWSADDERVEHGVQVPDHPHVREARRDRPPDQGLLACRTLRGQPRSEPARSEVPVRTQARERRARDDRGPRQLDDGALG